MFPPSLHRWRGVRRAALVAAMLEAHPVCERCQERPSTDVHELKSRGRGGSITDEANLACLCRTCHDWVTTHPADAYDEGWLLHSWDTIEEIA